jgi:hypothetical protein
VILLLGAYVGVMFAPQIIARVGAL